MLDKVTLYLFIMLIFFIQPVNAENYMAEAESYINTGDYSAAIIQLKNHLKNNPKHSKARYLLGSVYLKTDKIRFAEKELGKAYKLEQNNEQYRIEYARSLLLSQKYTDASDLLDIELNDSVLQAKKLAILGSIAYAEKDYQQAEHYFQQSVKKGNSEANISLAKMALYKKEFKKAELIIDKLLKEEPDNFSAWKLKAMIFNLSEQYQESLKIYTRLINEHNNDIELYLQRAATLLTLNNLSAAETDINFILKKNNRLPAANFLMAKLRIAQKNYKQAELFAEQVLAINIRHKPSLFISASANYKLKNLNKAEQRFQKLLKLEPTNINAQTLLARVYLAQDKAKNALLILESLPESVRNNNITILKTLTIAYLATGEFDKASSALRQAQKNNPQNMDIKKLLITSQLQQVEFEELMKVLESYTEPYKKAKKVDYLLLLSYFQQKKFTRFEEQVAQFIKKTPDDANLYIIQAKYKLYKSKNNAAKLLFNKALSYDKQHLPALRGLAKLAYKNKDFLLVKKYYQQILTIDNKDFMAYLTLAQLAEKEKDLISAEKYLQQMIDNNSGQNPGQISANDKRQIVREIKMAAVLMNFFSRHKMLNKKETVINNLIKNYPDNILVLSFASDFYIKSGQYKQAEKTIRSLINIDENNIKYHLLLAALLTKQTGHEEELFSIWDKAYSIDPGKPAALIAKHNYQLQKKRFKAATSITEQIKEKFPELNIADTLAGNGYLLSGDKESALQSYQVAFQIQPDNQLLVKIMKLKLILGSPDDSIVFLEKQLKNYALDKPLMLLHLAELYHLKKDYHQAINYYKQLLEKKPKNVVLMNNIAWNYMLLNDPKAVQMAEKAYKIKPNSADIVDTYGFILLKNNKINKAIEILSHAVKLAPEDNNIQLHLAKAYSLQHNTDKARSILETITQKDAAFSEKAAAEELLKQLN